MTEAMSMGPYGSFLFLALRSSSNKQQLQQQQQQQQQRKNRRPGSKVATALDHLTCFCTVHNDNGSSSSLKKNT